jgi:hypothetical protein
MRSTNARGNTEIYMPKDRTMAVNKLGELSALAASREWERAALIALIVRPTSGKRGRPAKMRNSSHSAEQMTMAEFIRMGIYGFRSAHAVNAYLKAWKIGGMDTPVFGQKAEMPNVEFPDAETLYGRIADDDDASAPDGIDAGDDDDDTEDVEDAQDEPSPRPQPHPQPHPKPRPEVNPIDKFLEVLDHLDPADVVRGGTAEQKTLLIKTLESWLDSLREAAESDADE